jgi:transposase
MARIETITMSMREIDRLKTIQAVVDGNLKPMQAAQRLHLTTRQVQRLVSRYRTEGASGLISRKRDRPSNRQLTPGLANAVLAIIRERYADFGPTLACEKLREIHEIIVSKETVRRLMSEIGFWIPRSQRSAKIYQPRNRRHCVGELIQIDGSDHLWFEERGPACTLLVYIDDATSRLMYLHFTYSESTFSYFEATRAYLDLYGKPQAFYSDKATVFRCNKKNVGGGNGCTQFGRAMYDLNIESICANSSQAKGRVERANLTLQDRMVKEMRLRNISTMAAANAYAPSFIGDFNRRFAKPPRNDFDAHRPLRADEDLALIFTVQDKRLVSSRLTLQNDKLLYLLADTAEARTQIGMYIDVLEYPDGHIEIRANGAALAYTIYDKLPVVNQAAIVENKRLGHVLQIVQEVQKKRDSRRGLSGPVHTNTGASPAQRKRISGTKSAKSLNMTDLVEAIGKIPLKPDMKKKSSGISLRSKKASPLASNDDIATNGDSAVAATIFSKTDRKKPQIQVKIKT